MKRKLKREELSGELREEYIKEIEKHQKKCEQAKNETVNALKKCRSLENRIEGMLVDAERARKGSREIFEKVSGALDAIGLSIRDIYESERRLKSSDSFLNSNEEKRKLDERLRRAEEGARGKRELERQQSEKDRDLAEKGRVASENARMIAECDREKRMKDFDIRLLCLEEERVSYPNALKNTDFNTRFFADTPQKLRGITLFGNSDRNCEKIKVVLDGEECVFDTKSPLRRVGKYVDELSVRGEEGYIIRRVTETIFTGDEDIMEEDGDQEKSIFILPLLCNALNDCDEFLSTPFKALEEVRLSGSYICLSLPRNEYPDKSALSEKLKSLKQKGTPFCLVFPSREERKESIAIPRLPESVREIEIQEGCQGSALFEINIFAVIDELNKKIEKLTKE